MNALAPALLTDLYGTLRFTAEDLAVLSGLGRFRADFLEHLRSVRFTGAMHALPEGTPFFADEPIVRVTAPILQAQLLESRLLNIVHFQTTIASKAARCVIAARGKRLVDFGTRRAHEGGCCAPYRPRGVPCRLRCDGDGRGRTALRRATLGHTRTLLHRSARWGRAGVAEFSAQQPHADHTSHRHL